MTDWPMEGHSTASEASHRPLQALPRSHHAGLAERYRLLHDHAKSTRLSAAKPICLKVHSPHSQRQDTEDSHCKRGQDQTEAEHSSSDQPDGLLLVLRLPPVQQMDSTRPISQAALEAAPFMHEPVPHRLAHGARKVNSALTKAQGTPSFT